MIKKLFIVSTIALLFVIGIFLYLSKYNNSEYSYKICRVGNGWGYDILKNSKPFIHQESIPALSGNKPFQTNRSAKITAKLVIKKLEKKEMPSLSRAEVIEIINRY